MRVSLKRGRFQSHTNQSYRNRHTVYAFVLGVGLSVVLVGAHSPSSDPVFSTPITSDIGGLTLLKSEKSWTSTALDATTKGGLPQGWHSMCWILKI
ncbi:MAG: hypothetical protein CM1200mP14_19350 [Gammaproteobacteria bacterium]|nr:MAG: hypothetical protein CM1200mP14_19350 [Gammaproteobacteria bacterium]